MSAHEETPVAKKAKVDESHECKDFKLHLTNVPSCALGESHQGKIIFTCKQSDLVMDVIKFMIDARISSVPVMTEKHNLYYGWIDWVPVVEYVISHFTKAKANGESGASDETKTAFELMQDSAHFKTLTVHDVMKFPRTNKNPFHPVNVTYSAFSAVEALAKDANLQRICIINNNRQVVTIVTQSDVLGYVFERPEMITEGKKSKTLAQCKNLMKPVVTVNEEDTVFNAFSKITRSQVHGAAIVKTTEAGDRITGNLSLRDMKNLGFGVEKFWRLHDMNIRNYILHLRREAEKGSRPRSWVTVKATETLFGTLSKLHEHNLHHVYILDDDKIPIGVVSIQDLLNEFIDKE